jgi:hypothetical protein
MAGEVNDRRQAQLFYSEVKSWQSELNTHVIDLLFFQRILDIYSLKVSETNEARDVHFLKQTLGSFLQHRVDIQKRKLKEHEEYLQKIVEDRLLLKDKEFTFRHHDAEKDMNDFRTGYRSLNQSLYSKIEQLKNF